jgi:hypothetical protein
LRIKPQKIARGRYYEKILKFCRYTLGGNMGYTEDCTRDIFLILYENMARLKDYDNIGGWLYKTTGNISKRYAAAPRKGRTDCRQKRPLKEIAARLNISLSAAKSRIGRLRQKIRSFAGELLALGFRHGFPRRAPHTLTPGNSGYTLRIIIKCGSDCNGCDN